MIRSGVACAIALVLCVSASGQDAGGRIEGYDKLQPDEPLLVPAKPHFEPPATPSDDDDTIATGKEEDARNLVETVMMVRLTETLHLDDEQSVVMVRRLRELKQEMMAMRRARGDLYRDLKNALRDDPDGTAIPVKLDALLEYDRKLETFKQDRLQDLSEGLTTAQRAQLYIFLCEFENDMRHLIHRAQGRSEDWRNRDGERRDNDWPGRGRWPDDKGNAPPEDGRAGSP